MRIQIERLEQLLRLWEDMNFLTHLMGLSERKLGVEKPTPLEGPLLHWRDLREDLLHGRVSENSKKYEVDSELLEILPHTSLPFEFESWTKSSRRVFEISHELQILLSLTSLQDVKWSEIRWPFESFVVALAEPLYQSDQDFDTILVSRDPRGPGKDGVVLSIRLISNKLEQFHPLSQFEKSQLLSQYKNGKHDKVSDKVMRTLNREILGTSRATALPLDKIGECRVTESYDQLLTKAGFGQLEAEGNDHAIRIVLGLCLYLYSLPSQSSHRSDWQTVQSKQKSQLSGRDSRAISDGANVCSVSSTFKLTREEKELVQRLRGRAISELSAHFRRGHWRRPPGQGQNPEALKTVWVRPTLVLKDKLKEGEVPGGAITQLV